MAITSPSAILLPHYWWVRSFSVFCTSSARTKLVTRLHSRNAAAITAKSVEYVDDDEEIPYRWALQGDDVKLLCKVRSRYNIIRVVDISRKADSVLAGSRVLLLDKPGNIHSLRYMFKALTGSYYDAFPSLPPLIPPGPVGILGLGAGTAAMLLHHFWPELEIHGWELDPAVVGVGRRFFDISDMEAGKPSDLMDDDESSASEQSRMQSWGLGSSGMMQPSTTGKLIVHIGDALSCNAVVDGGFAGLIVDLFSEGKVIPQLQDVTNWELLRRRLKPGGRVMVNCGGSCVEAEDKVDGNDTMQETFAALVAAFPGDVSVRIFYPGDNCIALTGPFPELQPWKLQLPSCLRAGVSEWRPSS